MARTPMGKERALGLLPETEHHVIAVLQSETSEAKGILQEGTPPLLQVEEPLGAVSYASKGGVLTPGHLWELGRFIKGAHLLQVFLHELEGEYPLLKAKGEGFVSLEALRRDIINCVDEDGNVLDTASRELAAIRRKIHRTENNLRETLESLIRSPAARKHLQEPIITSRGDRYVVPVKAENRQSIKGIVHDRSASGATVFVEPLKTVEMNNLIVKLKDDEAREVEAVLTALSGKIAAAAGILKENYRIYGQLDLIFARGKISCTLKGVEPSQASGGEITILQGRHPLIPEGEVVPVDLHIGGDFRSLIITGPNTGGKTVTLKTVGLFCLMAQSGLHVPAAMGTRLSVFRKVFSDIGDEQSIEQSLSTFSSHMSNIVSIISNLEEDSLVLLDELGAGTDPVEGAALAKALLSHLYRQGAITFATSHYSELKLFAFSHPGMQNASVEFDLETLAPTFRLLMGIPGKSNALEIAARLGLPAGILEEARRIQRKEDVGVEDMLADLLRKQKEAERDRERLAVLRQDSEKYLERARWTEEETKRKKADLLEKARDEALSMVTRARREAEEAYQELRKIKKGDAAQQPWERARDIKDSLRREQESLYSQKIESPPGKPLAREDLKEGMRVYINSLKKHGNILDIHEESGDVHLQVGILKIKTNPGDLFAGEEGDGEGQPSRGGFQKIRSHKASSIPLELDLRGLTLAESMDRVEKYLDDSLLAGMERVRIIHGKGTGVLRKGLQSYLGNHAQVAEYRLGEQGEGGSGVTVVTLKG